MDTIGSYPKLNYFGVETLILIRKTVTYINILDLALSLDGIYHGLGAIQWILKVDEIPTL